MTDAFTIAYEDAHLLVIDKPAGLVVHPARGHRTGTLAQLLGVAAAGGPDPERAGIVHRLDRDTSGLLIVARSEEAHRRLQRALAERRIVREYLALVHGRPPARTGTIEAPIGRDPRMRTRMAVDGAHPREARTHFEIERVLGAFTLLRLRRTPAAPTRSASTCRRSVIPSPAIRSMGRLRGASPVRSDWSASSCMPRDCPLPILSPARRSTSSRRCHPTCRPHWNTPNGYPDGFISTFHPRGALDRGPARTASIQAPRRVRGDRTATNPHTHKGALSWLKLR